MSRLWYYKQNGQTFGPLSSKQLRAEAQQGTLQPNDYVNQAGSAKWVEARKVKNLFSNPRTNQSMDTTVGVSTKPMETLAPHHKEVIPSVLPVTVPQPRHVVVTQASPSLTDYSPAVNCDDSSETNGLAVTLSSEWLDTIVGELVPGESFVWAGHPAFRIIMFRYLRKLVGTVAIILFIAMCAGQFVLGAGISFLLVLLGAPVCWWFADVHVVSHCYVVTNKRAFVFGGGQVENFSVFQLGDIRRRNYILFRGAGDLVFRTEKIHYVSGQEVKTEEEEFGFLCIDHVQAVDKLLRVTLTHRFVDKLMD